MKNIIAGLFVLTSLLGSGCGCATIEPGAIGIGVGVGGVEEALYREGLNFKSPLTTVISMSLQTQTYEMSGADEIHALTEDQLSVDLEVTVNFHLNEESAIDVYRAYSIDYANRIVHPIVRTAVRDAASTFTAIALVDERSRLQTEMESLVHAQLIAILASRNLSEDAIVVENVMLRNIDLPDSLEEAILNVQRQRQETIRSVEELATATAAANAIRTRANGEADANRILSESLTENILEARRIELAASMLENEHTRIMMIPSGATPLFSMPTVE
jgi:regulator of protease activity HflC (stomatin/prohibitin superfamily)